MVEDEPTPKVILPPMLDATPERNADGETKSEPVEKTPATATDDDSDNATDDDDGSMSLVAHLTELRERIIRALLAIAACSAVCYYFIEDIMRYISWPVGKLYYLQPAEAFFTYLKVVAFCGFLLALPVTFYQLWRFVLPAMTVRERTIVGIVVPLSVTLFFIGIAFSFFLVLPAALNFFGSFGSDTLLPMFSIGRYFDFVIAFVLPFGAVFELPLAIVMAAKLGFVSSEWLCNKQRVVIFMSFVVGAIITPTPDMFTQSMIALPMILLYEASYLVVKYVLRK